VSLAPGRPGGGEGRVEASGCGARRAGADPTAGGSCPLAAGAFACGYRQCAHANAYCQRSTSDVGNLGDDFQCRPLPAGCSPAPSCACLAGERCGPLCTGDGATGLTLTCPGG